MSCYNWESGIIHLPKAQFAKIKKQFIADYNDILQREMEVANRIRDELLAQNKGKRNVGWYFIVGDELDKFKISTATFFKMFPDHNKKPVKLTKKVMEFANGKTMRFDLAGEGDIVFDAENKTVEYDVPENNRAVERARESRVGKLFFKIMDNVNWTRGSGGSLYGNDEYNRENSYGGVGGGNYITTQWPKPKVDNRRRLW